MEYSCVDMPPGCVGVLFDDTPPVTTAIVKPYIIAILLHRGAVRDREVVYAMSALCSTDDQKIGVWDDLDQDYCGEFTRLEKIINEVLGEMTFEGLLSYNESKDLWVLTNKDIPKIISWVSVLDGKMPYHILSDIDHAKTKRWNS